MRICWADDRLDEARVFAEALDELNAEIEFFDDGETALRALREHAYDLLVTDLQMPPMPWGGLWLLRQMRSEDIRTPSIALSGEGAQQETIQAMRLGADYVMKSNVADELAARVRTIVSDADREILERDESDRLEFKSTLRADLDRGGASKDVEHSIVKTIAAFANSAGGLLVVGRSDAGVLLGLDADLKVLSKASTDGWELHLRNLIAQATDASVNQSVHVRFAPIDGKTIAFVSVSASPAPVFVRRGKGEEDLYIRAGNQTRALGVAEAMRYQRRRWP